MKNKNARNQQAVRQKLLEIGQDVGIQQMADFMAIVLNNPKVMGKDTFGKKRLEKVLDALSECFGTYKLAFSDHDEADYSRKVLDDELNRIYHGEAGTFLQRYPHIKEVTYLCKTRSG